MYESPIIFLFLTSMKLLIPFHSFYWNLWPIISKLFHGLKLFFDCTYCYLSITEACSLFKQLLILLLLSIINQSISCVSAFTSNGKSLLFSTTSPNLPLSHNAHILILSDYIIYYLIVSLILCQYLSFFDYFSSQLLQSPYLLLYNLLKISYFL